jgi:hypothetical protein
MKFFLNLLHLELEFSLYFCITKKQKNYEKAITHYFSSSIVYIA